MDRCRFQASTEWKHVPGCGFGQLLLSPAHVLLDNGKAVACAVAKDAEDCLYVRATQQCVGRLRFQICRQAPYNSLPAPYRTVPDWRTRPETSPETVFCRPISLQFPVSDALRAEARQVLEWIGVEEGAPFWQV